MYLGAELVPLLQLLQCTPISCEPLAIPVEGSCMLQFSLVSVNVLQIFMVKFYHTLMVLSGDPLIRLSPGSNSEKHVTAFLCSFMFHTRVADCPLMFQTY